MAIALTSASFLGDVNGTFAPKAVAGLQANMFGMKQSFEMKGIQSDKPAFDKVSSQTIKRGNAFFSQENARSDRSLIHNERTRRIQHLIDAAKAEAAVPNWDGEGAAPVSLESADLAQRFLVLLPNDIELPECFVDPRGKVHLAWEKGHNLVFGISFAPNGNVNFAGLFASDKIQGTQHISHTISEDILVYIKRVSPIPGRGAINGRHF